MLEHEDHAEGDDSLCPFCGEYIECEHLFAAWDNCRPATDLFDYSLLGGSVAGVRERLGAIMDAFVHRCLEGARRGDPAGSGLGGSPSWAVASHSISAFYETLYDNLLADIAAHKEAWSDLLDENDRCGALDRFMERVYGESEPKYILWDLAEEVGGSLSALDFEVPECRVGTSYTHWVAQDARAVGERVEALLDRIWAQKTEADQLERG